MSKDEVYDYIVIGSGSAGAVVAARLSEDADARVLLIEAGLGGDNPKVRDPFIPSIFEARHDADVTRNYIIGHGRAKADEWPQRSWPSMHMGHVRGGTSAINGSVYVRGNPLDFDGWAAEVRDKRWSYRNVLERFKRSEDYEHGETAYHGAGGPLPVRDLIDPSPVALAFNHAALEYGFDGPAWDFNGERQEDGAGLFQINTYPNNQRATTASAFLDPIAERENLVEKTSMMACRIGFEGHRAAWVDCLDIAADPAFKQGIPVRFRANREIVISAGAFESPKLLMHSGIGAAHQLRQHGIDTKVDLPGVGENLMDHMLVVMLVESPVPLPPSLWTGEACLFTRTSQRSQRDTPDLQYHVTSAIPLFTPDDYGADVLLCSPTLLQPKSRGHVRLMSADPRHQLLIEPNYLQHEADVRVLVEGMKLGRELLNTSPLSEFNKQEIPPGGMATDDASLAHHIRQRAQTVWHPAGTCRMGLDRMSVVDSQLRVYGVEGLRVADASIMPTITSGNTHAPCVMIGEMVAELIRGNDAGGAQTS